VSPRRSSLALVIAALAYPLIGIGLAAIGNFASRLAAWLLCGAVLVLHVAHERLRAAASPARAAARAAAAVAVGGLLLAGWVLVHGHVTGAHQSRLAPLALVVFPVVTAAPAFAVGWLLALALGRFRAQELR
jgi:hypothetical protein